MGGGVASRAVDDLHPSTFQPYVGTAFAMAAEEAPGPLLLAAVDVHAEQPHAPRPDPFSLVFTGPPGTAMGQGSYAVEHAEVGRLVLFLVPRQPAADGLPRYEATFN